MYPAPCIHGDGILLCESCRADWEEDSQAWEEFGFHAVGIENARRLQAEMDAEATRPQPILTVDPDIPF